MSRTIVGKARSARVALVLAAVLGIALLALPTAASAANCQEGEADGPVFSEISVTPAQVPATGGTGRISVRVTDECVVRQVLAEINTTEGFYESFELLPAEDINTNERVYRGEFEIPANGGESPVGWQVNLKAENIVGGFSEVLGGEVEEQGNPPFDEAPYVSEASVTPSVWGGLGGTSRITMRAYDLRGIANAYAVVTLPSGREREIQLEALSAEIFTALLPVPGNPESTPRGYGVSVFAEDDIGQTTGVYAGNVEVEPKGTPNPGFLRLEPGYLKFGPVTLGHDVMRTITLTNTGKPGSPAVSGLIRDTDPQFVLPDATEGGIPFTIPAGATRTYTVDFQPSLKGQQMARLSVVREDGRQPNTGLSLFGWGVN
jgi:hypothetical protein